MVSYRAPNVNSYLKLFLSPPLLFTEYSFTTAQKAGTIQLIFLKTKGAFSLRSVDSWLDRFCYKHPRFAIRNLALVIVVGNILVYMLDMVSSGTFSSLLFFSPYLILHGQIWRLISFIFVPMDSNPFTLILSLYFLWWMGTDLEREWGSCKFTVYYGIGVLMNIIVGMLLYLPYHFSANAEILPYLSTASTYYLNLSLFFALATLFPDMQILLFFFIPVKVKWMAWLDAAFFVISILASAISLDLPGVVLPIIAVLNYVLFFWSDIIGFFKRKIRQAKYRNSKQTINFKEATRHAQERKGYLHKCAVCGKTDTDYPDEEFRYCSQCNGYYCYCSEHIHNHVHIQ